MNTSGDQDLQKLALYAAAQMHNNARNSNNKNGDTSGSRGSFIPRSDGPGPAQYEQDTAPIKTTAARTVFGSSSRDQEQKRFISTLHSATMPPMDTPGAGTYRVMKADKYPHSPKRSPSPTFKFGTAAQRTSDEERVGKRSPGPIYSQDLNTSGPNYTFAPMGSIDLGIRRTRSDSSGVFITKEHAAIDHSASKDNNPNTGPGRYDTSNYRSLSPVKRPVGMKFGRASKDAKNSYTQEQLESEPVSGSAASVPGPVYDLPPAAIGAPGATAHKFGTGPKTYSPGPDGKGAGPYLSRLHEHAQMGVLSPGPGSYNVTASSPRNKAIPGWFGDAPGYGFGTGPQRDCTKPAISPGPGAHTIRQDPLSRCATAPAFTIAPALRTNMATLNRDPSIPGPGTYEVMQASKLDAQHVTPAAYSMTGTGTRDSFIPKTCSPGPAAYTVVVGGIPSAAGAGGAASRDTSPTRGYSFGMKEKTLDSRSTVSVRYHGPLASQEHLGTQSPGPGCYDISAAAGRLSPTRRAPDVKFGSAIRMDNKAYISALHAQAEGLGADSPGPTQYDHHAVELAQVTSKYRKPPAAAFSGSPRFKTNYMTF